jgi:hypothetical protein
VERIVRAQGHVHLGLFALLSIALMEATVLTGRVVLRVHRVQTAAIDFARERIWGVLRGKDVQTEKLARQEVVKAARFPLQKRPGVIRLQSSG